MSNSSLVLKWKCWIPIFDVKMISSHYQVLCWLHRCSESAPICHSPGNPEPNQQPQTWTARNLQESTRCRKVDPLMACLQALPMSDQKAIYRKYLQMMVLNSREHGRNQLRAVDDSLYFVLLEKFFIFCCFHGANEDSVDNFSWKCFRTWVIVDTPAWR